MNHIYLTMQKYVPAFNRKVLTEDDGYLFCEKHNISVLESEHIDGEGMFIVYKGHSFIFLSKFLKQSHRAFVLWHEIGHAILHYPLPCGFSFQAKRKIEKEAEIVACMSIVPLPLLVYKLHELHEEYGIPIEVILRRKEIFDLYQK